MVPEESWSVSLFSFHRGGDKARKGSTCLAGAGSGCNDWPQHSMLLKLPHWLKLDLNVSEEEIEGPENAFPEHHLGKHLS